MSSAASRPRRLRRRFRGEPSYAGNCSVRRKRERIPPVTDSASSAGKSSGIDSSVAAIDVSAVSASSAHTS